MRLKRPARAAHNCGQAVAGFPLLCRRNHCSLALAFARSEMERGTPTQELLAVASQSAEFATRTELCNRGSPRQDIHLTAAALLWPEDGPED